MLKKVLLIAAAAEAGVMALMMTVLRNGLIIGLGIRGFNGLLYAGGAAFVITLIAAGVVSFLAKREEQSRAAAEAGLREAESGLSAEKKLENKDLRAMLQEYSLGDWKSLAQDIEPCIEQLHGIDSEQERLHVLLKHNAAEVLADTESILDQAEQSMCRNVRKVLNYMSVYHQDSSADTAMMRGNLAKCREDNDKILNEAHEFLVALTEYLNGQGDSKYDNTMLESYKKTLLDFTEKKEKEKENVR